MSDTGTAAPPDRELPALLPPPPRMEDLLTPDERAELDRDLAEIARSRRRAYDRSADLPLP